MKLIIGILLIPISVSLTFSLVQNLSKVDIFEKNQFLFVTGFISYLIVHIVFYKPVFAYIISHEITHALWAWVFGKEVKDIKASKESGHVTVSSTNAFITLIPYFFPFYSLLILLIILIAQDKFIPYLIFLLGASFSFHLVLTLHSIAKGQKDLKDAGRIFSLSFVYFMNLIIIILILCLIVPSNFKPDKIFNDAVTFSLRVFQKFT